MNKNPSPSHPWGGAHTKARRSPAPKPLAEQGHYTPAELLPSQRPGANDFAQWPSRVGRWRVYLDGRKEAV